MCTRNGLLPGARAITQYERHAEKLRQRQAAAVESCVSLTYFWRLGVDWKGRLLSVRAPKRAVLVAGSGVCLCVCLYVSVCLCVCVCVRVRTLKHNRSAGHKQRPKHVRHGCHRRNDACAEQSIVVSGMGNNRKLLRKVVLNDGGTEYG